MRCFFSEIAVPSEVINRQQYVHQSIQLEGLYREIVRALTDLSVKNNDKQIADMLASQGITITVGAQDAAGQREAGG